MKILLDGITVNVVEGAPTGALTLKEIKEAVAQALYALYQDRDRATILYQKDIAVHATRLLGDEFFVVIEEV
jgi:hypothetical protein